MTLLRVAAVAALADRLFAGYLEGRRAGEAQLLARHAALQPGGSPPRMRQELEWLQQHTAGYAWLGVADASGLVIAATGGLLQGESIASRPVFREGLGAPWRRAADKLRHESEVRLAAVIRSASDAVISADVHGRIELFNPAAERIFGRPAQAVIGETLDMLLPPERRERHRADLAAFAASKVTRRGVGVGRLQGLRAEQSLMRYQPELTALTQRLMAQEKTTTRLIARSLHDQLGQTLAAIRLGLDALPAGPAGAGRHARARARDRRALRGAGVPRRRHHRPSAVGRQLVMSSNYLVDDHALLRKGLRAIEAVAQGRRHLGAGWRSATGCTCRPRPWTPTAAG